MCECVTHFRYFKPFIICHFLLEADGWINFLYRVFLEIFGHLSWTLLNVQTKAREFSPSFEPDGEKMKRWYQTQQSWVSHRLTLLFRRFTMCTFTYQEIILIRMQFSGIVYTNHFLSVQFTQQIWIKISLQWHSGACRQSRKGKIVLCWVCFYINFCWHFW